MARNWSEIPDELVYLVGEKVVRVDDLVRFGAVCKSWRSVSTLKKEHPFAPLIMLAKADNDNLPTIDENDKGIRTFVVPYGGQGQQEKMTSFDLEVPKAQGRSCWGSPYGWLVTAGLDLGVHILNPLTGVQIPLPSLTNLHQQANAATLEFPPVTLIGTFTRRFVVGWNPSLKGELIVMAIFGMHSTVAITTCMVPGNEIEASSSSSSWRLVKTLFGFSGDVIFFNGRIFIIGLEGTLSSCDINQTPLRAIPLVEIADIIENARPKSIQVESRPSFYLVEICGHLHLVFRFFERVLTGRHMFAYYNQTKYFRVYRFNFREIKWNHVPDLGEYALFVGNHTSFTLSTINYTDFSSNSIYFTEDDVGGYESSYCDTGVFNYNEGAIEKFDFTNHGTFSKFSRPTFFMPAF